MAIKTKKNEFVMKKIAIIFSILIIVSCNKQDDQTPPVINPQNVSLLVEPIQTDSNYLSTEKKHYVVRNNQIHLNKLLLFIGGSYSSPEQYKIICDYGASIGLDVISLSYPNNVATAPLGSSSDRFVFDKYRDEICFGNPVSDKVDVNHFNSINTRAVKLLEYLHLQFPDQNWNQYLTSSNTLQWNKIIVAGHSQGSGHACYLGKINLVDRVVMFSGPNDYSTFHNEPANWISQIGNTPLNKQFSLLHTQDEIVSFSYQVEIVRDLGLLSPSEMPTLVDNLSPPYSNSNSLSVNIPAILNHNSTVGGNPILPEVWKYMFTRD